MNIDNGPLDLSTGRLLLPDSRRDKDGPIYRRRRPPLAPSNAEGREGPSSKLRRSRRKCFCSPLMALRRPFRYTMARLPNEATFAARPRFFPPWRQLGCSGCCSGCCSGRVLATRSLCTHSSGLGGGEQAISMWCVNYSRYLHAVAIVAVVRSVKCVLAADRRRRCADISSALLLRMQRTSRLFLSLFSFLFLFVDQTMDGHSEFCELLRSAVYRTTPLVMKLQ